MLIALTIMVFLILVLLIMHRKDNARILDSLVGINNRLDSQTEKQTNILDNLEKIEFNCKVS